MTMAIRFYSKNKPFSAFSNFTPCGVEMDGRWYPTVEHYFQAQQFHDAVVQRYRAKQTGQDFDTGSGFTIAFFI